MRKSIFPILSRSEQLRKVLRIYIYIYIYICIITISFYAGRFKSKTASARNETRDFYDNDI